MIVRQLIVTINKRSRGCPPSKWSFTTQRGSPFKKRFYQERQKRRHEVLLTHRRANENKLHDSGQFFLLLPQKIIIKDPAAPVHLQRLLLYLSEEGVFSAQEERVRNLQWSSNTLRDLPQQRVTYHRGSSLNHKAQPRYPRVGRLFTWWLAGWTRSSRYAVILAAAAKEITFRVDGVKEYLILQ